MKIFHLNQFGSREAGGVEGYIGDVTVALQKAGHRSHLVYFAAYDSDSRIPASTYAPLDQWPASIERTSQVIEQVIAEFRPDVAYVHAVYHPEVIRWIAECLPTLFYVHGPYPVCPGSAQYLRNRSRVCPHTVGPVCLVNAQLERCCWGRNPIYHLQLLARSRAFVKNQQHVKGILVGSNFMKGLLQRAGISTAKIYVLPPILIQEPVPTLTSAADSKNILFAGRLTFEKGLHLLIEALASLTTDWQLIVAGEGEEREPNKLLATRLGVAERVHFVGWLSASQMAATLQTSACVVVPSLWPEPFGRVGPEAFLHGRPVVAFATGGIPDWLEDGMSGYLVETGDVNGLGQKVQSLLDSPALRIQMGQYARNRALSAWNAQIHIEKLLQIFADIL